MRAVLLLFFVTMAFAARAAVTPDELRDMAYAGDIEGVEAAIAEAHQDTLEGVLAYDDLREIVDALNVSHPDVVKFVKDWLESRPESTYAKTLSAMHIRETSWRIRGQASRARTHDEALRLFTQMRRQGLELALSAFYDAPDFVPASDAVFVLGFTSRLLDRQWFEDIVAQVMATTPSRTSLAKARLQFATQWGGRGYGAIIDLCNQYAELVTDVDGYTADVCAADLIYYYPDSPEAIFYADAILDQSAHPILLEAKAKRGMVRGHVEDRAIVLHYLSQPDILDVDMAFRFEGRFLADEDSDTVMEIVDRKMHEFVAEGMLHNPFDTEVTRLAQRVYAPFGHEPTVENSEIAFLVARRRAAASPYSANEWSAVSSARPRIDGFADMVQETASAYDPYQINAIYYGYHQRQYLWEMLQTKVGAYSGHQRLSTSKAAEISSPLSEADLETKLLCPITRLNRLIVARCKADGFSADQCYENASHFRSVLSDALNEVAKRDICVWERNANFRELRYEPVEIDIEALEVGLANR